MTLFQFEENGVTAWGFEGDGVFQDRTPEGALMSKEEAEQLLQVIESRIHSSN
jgi:hypothetical protein